MSLDRHFCLNRAFALLTIRERDVKALLIKGWANKVIAAELGISQRTVETYRARIFKKFEVRNAVELTGLLLSSSPNYADSGRTVSPSVAEPMAQVEDDDDDSLTLKNGDLSDKKKAPK